MIYAELEQRIARLANSGNCNKDESSILSILSRRIRPQLSAVFESCECIELDRTQSMLFGRPWTSESHPWPLGQNGAPLGAILQLDLDRATNYTNRQCGSGLLQVFMPSHEEIYGKRNDGTPCLVRVVPRKDIDNEELTPYPWEEKTPIEVPTSLGAKNLGYSNADLKLPASYEELSQIKQVNPSLCEEIESGISFKMSEAGFVADAYRWGPGQLIVGWNWSTLLPFQILAAMDEQKILSSLRKSGALDSCVTFGDESSLDPSQLEYVLNEFTCWLDEEFSLVNDDGDDPFRFWIKPDTSLSRAPYCTLFPHLWVTNDPEAYIPHEESSPLIECCGPDTDQDAVAVDTDLYGLLVRTCY